MTDVLESHVAACVEIARRHDRERYLVSLFAPPSARAGLFAVLAANHEIAKTAEVVSDPTIGLIRLQWWREAFDGIEAGTPRSHEVVLPLAKVARWYPEVLGHLRRVVDGREADLGDDPPATLDALSDYAGATGGEVVAAMARILDADSDAAHDLGTAWALIGLVRALPALLAGGLVRLPTALLEESGLTISKIKDNPTSVDLAPVCRPIVERGLEIVQALDVGRRLTGRNARPLRLLAARARDLGDGLVRHGSDPRAVAVMADSPGLIWRHALRATAWRVGF